MNDDHGRKPEGKVPDRDPGAEPEHPGEAAAGTERAARPEADGGGGTAEATAGALRDALAASSSAGDRGPGEAVEASVSEDSGAAGPDAPWEPSGGPGPIPGAVGSHPPTRRRFQSLSVQLGLGLGGAVALTLAATVVAGIAFLRVGTLQQEINEEYVPALTAAVRIAQRATLLASYAPRLVAEAANRNTAARGGEDFGETDAMDLMENSARMIELSSALGTGERAAGLRGFAEDLAGNLRDIQVSVDRSSALQDRLVEIRLQAAALGQRMEETMVPLLDDQVFYMATGLRETDDVAAPVSVRGSEAEVLRLRALTIVDARSALAVSLLGDAIAQEDPELVITLGERFQAAVSACSEAIQGLDAATAGLLAEPLAAIDALGFGDEGAFPVRSGFLTELGNQRTYLARNHGVTTSLESAVASFTTGLEQDAVLATEASERAVDIGSILLIALNVVAIGGATLILWLFVGRFVMARLNGLSRAMRRMAEGDLKTRIAVRGKDEIGEMAQALEVFRRHALEVQRLNLVEQLARRVESQNAELAKTLSDLRRAQDQIVMQEKLASLGQLTAGIAHEIKNPLNFVNNFAALSKDLLEDLNEELDGAGDAIPDGTKEAVSAIRTDLSGNLERIVHHGKRASSIVYGMLEHSRKEAGAARPTEINAMLDEYIGLAFHSMRAADNTFQMTIEKDLGEETGAIEAVPQDLSRVFLNIVTNACQAMLEKQRAPGASSDYQPTLHVRSRRENGTVEVRIRDNGPGIPREHLERVFEPFFTTKENSQGTGLGLSLSHNIVHGHGGTLRVETESGRGAEFIITLPVNRPPELEGRAAAE